MKIAILGYGDQGRAAYEYWGAAGHEITICDVNTELVVPDGVQTRLGTDYLKDLDTYDLLVRTPILHPRDILAANPQHPEIVTRVTSVTNEFMRVCPTKNIIGVTGTKGKGTTCTLIAKMLEATGKRVHLGGNIGTPPLDLLKNSIQPGDWVVLELANFQLIDLKYSPGLAVCLMVEAEHMDWHADLTEYITAKQQLFRWQTPEDTAIFYNENEHTKDVVSVSAGTKIPYFAPPGAAVINGEISISATQICKTDELKLLGKHNWQNACAAVTAVWQITQDAPTIRNVLTSFTGLEHRLELIRELDGIKYYDDSFGTTPATAIVAMQALDQPKIVILGGSDKGATYELLAQAVVQNNVRGTVLVGETGPAIEAALKLAGYEFIYPGGQTMTDIVTLARSLAKPGDVVLLSTACASFGLFKNYKDRGEQFKQAVLVLV